MGQMVFFANPIAHPGMVYLPTWTVDFYGFHAGKYTSPMDGKGMIPVFIFFSDE